MQRVKVTANPKLGEWLQQVPGTTSKICREERSPGTAKILHMTLQLQGLW